MDQKYLYSGISFVVLGIALNAITIWLTLLMDPVIPGEPTHSGPPIAGTLFLLLVPIGIIFNFYHLWLQYKTK